NAVHQILPEALVPAAVKIGQVDTLLLNPGVITEVEDALSIKMREFKDVIVHDAREVAAENLAGVHFVESVAVPSGQKILRLACIKVRAVRRHGHDGVLGAEIEMLCKFDACDDVSESGKADIVKAAHHLRIDLLAPDEITASDIAAK